MPPTEAHSERTPEFDRKLLAYQPALRALSRKIAKHDDATEELFQQAMLLMLKRHDNCRTETFWTWAKFCVRNAAQEHVKHNGTLKRSGDVVSMSAFVEFKVGVNSSQYESAELSAVLGLLAGRSGAMTLRLAMGDTLEAIGRDYGIGRERVRQIVERERARVLALMEPNDA